MQIEGLISIIVPVYNADKYLDMCINSLTTQTYSKLEIILINDGSQDTSGKICDRYAKRDERIKVIHKKNEGVSSARNQGLDIAKGEYIGFVDADDYIDANMYKKLIESMIKNESDLSICNDSSNVTFNGMNEKINNIEALSFILDKDKFRGYSCNKLYKKELLENIRFDEEISLCEDLLFNCLYINKCKTCSIINEKLYFYIPRKESAVNKFNKKHYSVIKAYEKLLDLYNNYEEELLYKLKIAYFKQCTFLKFYSTIYKNADNYKNIIDKKRKQLIEDINNTKINLKEKIILNIYYLFPIFVCFLREIKKIIKINLQK